MLSLAAIPWASARRDPLAPALRLDGSTMDYLLLDRAVAGMAALLERRGIGAGDRIALYCGNGLAAPVAYYGVMRVGAVVAPMSTASPPAELARSLRQVRARMLVCDLDNAATAHTALRLASTGARRLVIDQSVSSQRDAASLGALAEHPSTDPRPVTSAAPAVVLGTSGTTGTPRRALHSHIGLLLNARAVATEMLALGPDDVQLGALPLTHSFGMSAVLNASLLAGSAVALMRHFDAEEALRVIAGERVTVLQGVPTMFGRMAEASPRPPTAVRLCVVSGAPLPHGMVAAVTTRLCARVVERYGMTEVSPLTMRDIPADGGEPGDVGIPLNGVVVRTIDGAAEGELEAASATMFLGYDGDRRATAEALRGGFFRTGDLGQVGAGGRVTLVGRLKDVIVRGGNNVAAREVERVLETHPDVAEAAVVGVPHPDLGEEVAAAIVLRRGGRSSERIVAQLESRCREQLSGYKRPRRWEVVDRLPRTASGKVRKDEVRSLILEVR